MRFWLLNIAFFVSGLLQAQIHITEINPRNTGLLAKDSTTPDWIEIGNTSDSSIRLAKWFLSDNKNNLRKWAFPDTLLEAHSFLVVFASGNDTVTDEEIHTNFKIRGDGEKLYLSNLDSLHQTTASVCAPPNYSIIPALGTDLYLWDSVPSPGNPAEHTFHIPKDTLQWSLESGIINTGIPLDISSGLGFDVRYTQQARVVNHATPVFSSNEFEWNFNPTLADIPTSDSWDYPEEVPMIMPVAARSFFQTCPVSPNEIRTFIPEGSDFAKEKVISLMINPSDFYGTHGIYVEGPFGNYWRRGRKWERDVHLTYFSSDSIYLNTDVGARITGSGSRANPQKSLRLYFRKSLGLDTCPNLFFQDRDSSFEYERLVLRATGSDFTGSLIRDELFANLLRHSSIDYLSGEPILVFLNGEYWGIHFVKEYTNKHLLANRYELDAEDINIIENQGYVTEGSDDLWIEVREFMNFEDLTEPDAYRWISDRIDLDNLCEYIVYQDLAANWDVTQNNVKIWYSNEADAKIRFIAFDGDATHYRHDFDMIDFLLNDDEVNILPFMFQHLWENRSFQSQLAAAYVEVLGNLPIDEVFEDNSATASILSRQLHQHQLRWHTPVSIHKWNTEMDKIQGFFQIRRETILQNLMKHTDGVLVFPNPASESIRLDIPLGSQVAIVDLTGRVIHRTIYNGAISVQSFPSGPYLLRYNFETIQQTTRFNIVR